jgi:hypothetical protein
MSNVMTFGGRWSCTASTQQRPQRRGQVGQTKGVVELSMHQQSAIGTDEEPWNASFTERSN